MVLVFTFSLIRSQICGFRVFFCFLIFLPIIMTQILSATPALGAVEFPGPVKQTLLASPMSAVSVPWEGGNGEILIVGDDQGYLTFVQHVFDDVNFGIFTRYNISGDILWMDRWQGGPYGQRGLVVATANPDRLHFLEISNISPYVNIYQTLELPEDPGTGTFVSGGPENQPQMALSLPGIDEVIVLRQNSGLWSINQHIDAGDAPWSLAAVDLDNDEVLEFVSADRGDLSGTLGIFSRQIDGTYVLESHQQLAGRVQQVGSDDFNLDGVQELVVSYSDLSRLDIMSRETGQWQTHHILESSLPPDFFTINILANGDFSIVASVEERGIMDFFHFSADAWVLRDSYYVGCEPRSLVSCDLNGDEVNEIVCVGYSEQLVSILLGNTAPGFWGFPAVTLPPNPNAAILGDFDGDGLDDLVVGTLSPNTLNFYPRLPDGGLSGQAMGQAISFFPASLVAGDVMGGSDNELLALDASANKIKVYSFENEVGFRSETEFSYSSAFAKLRVADIDHDGLLDIYAAQSSRQQLDVLFGMGEGEFAPVLSLDFPLGTFDAVALDLNNDLLLDFAVTDGQGRVWTVLNGNGRSFGGPVATQANTQPRSLDIADLDGDSDMDIVVGNFFSETLTFLENNGDGSLTRRIGGLSLGGQPVNVQCRDINGDNIPDVIVRMLDGEELNLAVASEIWNYPYAAPVETSGGVMGALLDDFNQDSKLDVLILDSELQLGLVMYNTQRYLVSVDPAALTFSCAGENISIGIIPDRPGPWHLDVSDGESWRVLAANGQAMVGELDFDGRRWLLEFSADDFSGLDSSLVLRLTVGVTGDQEFLDLALDADCFDEAGGSSLSWQEHPWPNPFNPSIQGRVRLDTPAQVDAGVYDLAGHRVATLLRGYLPAGVHPLSWDGQQQGRAAAAGLYLLRIQSENTVLSQKIILLK